MLILQENDLEKFVKEKVKELEEVEDKTKHNKDMIITDWIKYNPIPQFPSMETPK